MWTQLKFSYVVFFSAMLALGHMLDLFSNPITALHRYHPRLKFSSFKTKWKAKILLTVKPMFRLPEWPTSRKATDDVVIALSVFTCAGEGDDADVFRELPHSPKRLLNPCLTPCFSIFSFYSAATCLDWALKLAARTQREHSARLF